MIDPKDLGKEIGKQIIEAVEETSDQSSFNTTLDEIVKDFVNEASLSNVGPDDGPGFMYPNFDAYKKASVSDNKGLLDTGWEIVDYMLDDDQEQELNPPIYPNGPVGSVSYFPSGDIGVTTPTNQEDIYGVQAYNKWKKHVMNMLKSLGWEIKQSKQQERLTKKLSVDSAKSIKNQPVKDRTKGVQKAIDLEESLMNEIPYSDLKKIDNYADSQLNPVDVVLTGRHFFDRLQDPRNKKEISQAELIGFFKRLSKKKKDFLEFIKKYDQIVAKDNRTKLNIPFMKQANKVIAKTIMRKDDFKTSNPSFHFENKDYDKVEFYKNYYKNVTPSGFEIDSDGNTIKIQIPNKITEEIHTLPDSLGIDRSKMPQIKSTLMGDYIRYIDDMGIRVRKKKLPISTLKNTQGHLNKKKIQGLLQKGGKESLQKPFIISSDNYILDGHHRANALYNIDDKHRANVIQINLPIKKLIQVTHDFSKVKYKDIDESYTMEVYIEDTPYAGILENMFIGKKNIKIEESIGLSLNESVYSSEEMILDTEKDIFSEMVIQQTLGILSESGALPGVTQVPSSVADKVVGEFIKKVLQPLNIVKVDSVVGLGSTRAILKKLPTAKKMSGDLDLLAIAKQDSRSAVSKLVSWAQKRDYDYQVAFGNIFSVAYPFGKSKYQVDLMISQPSEEDEVYNYMRKFKYFSDEDPSQKGDFILKGAHRSELAKTVVKAMGLSAAESGFKQFKWNDKYNDVNTIADTLEKKASRFRDKDKQQQTLELVDLLRNKIKDIRKLKKYLVDQDDLLKDRYPSSLFKSVPKAFDLMIDMLFSKENTPETWEKVLDRKFKVSNAIERMNKFDDVMKIMKELLKKRLITPRGILGVFTEMKKNFDTGKAAAKWNRSLEEYIEKQFPFLKNRW